MSDPTLTIKDFGMSPEARLARMRRIGDVIVAEWGAEARGELRSSLGPYLQSIAIRELTDRRVVVQLPGPGVDGKVAQLARIMEFGMGPGGIGTEGPYDVRKFLLGGTAKWKWGKNGPYVNVPFRFTQMDIGLQASGGPKGSQAVLNAVARLRATTTGQNGKTQWGGRLKAGMANKMKEHHKTDLLAGLVRKAGTFSAGAGGKARVQTTGHMTFRTASWSNTDPRAWLSSGVKARRIGDRIAARIQELVDLAG
jgi:hypothetical protein